MIVRLTKARLKLLMILLKKLKIIELELGYIGFYLLFKNSYNVYWAYKAYTLYDWDNKAYIKELEENTWESALAMLYPYKLIKLFIINIWISQQQPQP